MFPPYSQFSENEDYIPYVVLIFGGSQLFTHRSSKYMYLRAKYTKYKMAKTKFSIWRYIICEICKKNGSNRPFLASRVADTIFPPPIEGYHRQLDNQCKDPMDNNKDCRVGQLTNTRQPLQTFIAQRYVCSWCLRLSFINFCVSDCK